MSKKKGSQGGTGEYPVIYRNLMSAGLLGSIYRLGTDADIINAAVELTLDDPRHFRTYRAVALAMAGQVDYAHRVLGSQIEEHPHDDDAKVALGLSLLLGGDPDWRSWIDNVLATSNEQPVREAALGVLSYVGSSPQFVH
jgi:hypothetical protein